MFENSFFLPDDITEQRVNQIRGDTKAHRICFPITHKTALKRKEWPEFGTFKVPFYNTVGSIFVDETGLELPPSQFGGHWLRVSNEIDYKGIENWIQQQGTRVFLRDCLDSSLALDHNKFEKGDGSRSYTQLGQWESDCKRQDNPVAFSHLVNAFDQTLSSLIGYKDAKYLCAVPPRPNKPYDLPSKLAAAIATKRQMIDLTPQFEFEHAKAAIKDLPISEKWPEWERTGLKLHHQLTGHPPVVLIDDKYQSGITLQFVASRLRQAGAGGIYGLCAVKTYGDKDNT